MPRTGTYIARVVPRSITRAYVPGSYKRSTLRGPIQARALEFRRNYRFTRPSDRVGRSMSLKQKLNAAVENKYVDGTHTSTLVTTTTGAELPFNQNTATYGSLPIPNQGDGFFQRDGRKIFVKWIHIRGTLHWDGVNGAVIPSSLGPARLVLVKDTKTNKAQLSSENVMNTGTGSDGNQVTNLGVLTNPTNPIGWGRYKILKDKTFNPPVMPNFYDAGSATDRNTLVRHFKMKVKVMDYVNFDGTTGAIGSVIDNSYHLLGYALSGAVNVDIEATARTAFIG